MNESSKTQGDIPVVCIRGETLAIAYENALYQLYKNGIDIKTQYDKENDPPSKDCTLNLTIESPLKDPMIHKAFPGGIYDLREYVYELHGLKNEWVKCLNDPNDTRWEYTYHGRFTKYGQWKILTTENNITEKKWAGLYNINQVDHVINKLIKQPYTRQAQIITWMPNLDLDCYDPPCLQSLIFRITNSKSVQPEYPEEWILSTNIRFRSNDAWGASFMNMFGLIQFIKTIGGKINHLSNIPVRMGRINWQADSYHIYGKDLESVKYRLINKIDNKEPFEKRILNFYSEDIQEMYHECEPAILEKIKNYKI